ncbi:hypothetical protein [Microbacterium sp. LWH12-1.2]
MALKDLDTAGAVITDAELDNVHGGAAGGSRHVIFIIRARSWYAEFVDD